MSNRRFLSATVLLSGVLAIASAHADMPDVTTSEFMAQRQKIEAELSDGKTYNEITPEQRREVRESLSIMANRFQGKTSTAELSQDERVEVYNLQQRVNSILTQARDDSRLVCERTQRTGSHRVTTNCMSVAERRRERESSQELVRREFQRAPVGKNN